MRLSKNFLNDYIDIANISFSEIADKMVFLGNEYDEIKKLCPATNLVIGKVIECIKHSESNKLSVCKVDIGEETVQIVCGAPNVAVDKKVIVAKIGAVLPGDFIIKKAKLAGIDSEGMICSLAELGIENKYLNKDDIDGIHILEDDAPIGEDAIKYLELDDEVIDFDLTADRSDLLSVLGMAYEVGALYDLDVKYPKVDVPEIETKKINNYSLEVLTENCTVYLAKLVNNVKIEESPKFIKNRLIASGIRPINNVVDISNYVMLETGQPLHFFDADKLGSKIKVRMANDGEKITTLDNIARNLTDSDIVITDGLKPVALAGVMGGIDTEVTSNTQNIIIESAIFNGINIRTTSKKTLRSESSNRFEKGLCKERTYFAIKRACYLLNKYAKGEVVTGMLTHDVLEEGNKEIKIKLSKINTILGMNLSLDEVLGSLRKLKLEHKIEGDDIIAIIPPRRLDINIVEDLIEEIGRIVGYDKVVGILPNTQIKKGSYGKNLLTLKNIRKQLQGIGLNQVITYSLVSEEEVELFINAELESVKLLDPISKDKMVMRKSLIPSLLNTYKYNSSRNFKNIHIFEIASVYHKEESLFVESNRVSGLLSGVYLENKWQQKEIMVDFYLVKGIIENVLEFLGLNNRYQFSSELTLKDMHPGRSASIVISKEVVGMFGQVSPLISKNPIYVFELNIDKILNIKSKKIKFKEPSKFPSVVKDLSFIVDKEVSAIEIENVINKSGGRLLKEIQLFDVYVGNKISDNKKALAFSLTFKDETRTLNDEEVMAIFNKIINDVEIKLNAKLRNE